MVTCTVLTSEDEIQKIAAAWSDLHRRVGLTPFTDIVFAQAWWRTIGQPSGAALRVICCYDGDRLVGLLPLTIRKKAFVRVVRLLGHEAYYYRNFLAERPEYLAKMWDTAFAFTDFDLAVIKNVHAGTIEDDYFGGCAKILKASIVYHCELSGKSREEVLSSFSKRFRKKHERAEEALRADKLMESGITLEGPVSVDVIDFLVKRKKAWTIEKGKRGLFNEENPDAFYHEIVRAGLALNKLVLYWMRREGKPVAASLSFIEKGVLYGHTLAFDPSVSYLIPGLYLSTEALLWANENGFKEKNFMEGEEEYKQRFTKKGRVIHEYAFVRTLAGYIFLCLYRMLCFLRKHIPAGRN